MRPPTHTRIVHVAHIHHCIMMYEPAAIINGPRTRIEMLRRYCRQGVRVVKVQRLFFSRCLACVLETLSVSVCVCVCLRRRVLLWLVRLLLVSYRRLLLKCYTSASRSLMQIVCALEPMSRQKLVHATGLPGVLKCGETHG